jgi:uncharacterized protein YggE
VNPRTAREHVAAALSSVPDLRVWAYPHTPDQPTSPTVVLAVQRVVPADVACPYVRTELDVWLFTQATTDAPAWDALDDALATVLDALDAAGVRWTEASTGVWNATHPAYRITTEAYA